MLLADHIPPGLRSPSVVVVPAHRLDDPVTDRGSGFTVTTAVTVQPEPNEYVMVAVPAVAPVTIPVVKPTVATSVGVLLQVPNRIASDKADVSPWQISRTPVIGDGTELTVTTSVEIQP